jgi:hypothetical protein
MNNGFVALPTNPTTTPLAYTSETKRPVHQQQHQPGYSDEETRLIREQNLKEYRERQESLRNQPTQTQRPLHQPDVTDVSQWLQKK